MYKRQLQSYVKTEMASFEESLVKRFRKAKSMGELPRDFNEEISAQIIFTYLQGYYRVVQVLKTREHA